VLINAPATCTVAEVVDDRLYRSKCPVAIVAADEDMALAESYDIRKAISCGIPKEAEVAIEAPTSSSVTEVVERDVDGIEGRIAIVPGNNDTTFPKSDNVASPDASNISKVADVLLDAPSTGIVSEIFEDKFDRLSEAVVTVVDRD
jgi:hypothetical protein